MMNTTANRWVSTLGLLALGANVKAIPNPFSRAATSDLKSEASRNCMVKSSSVSDSIILLCAMVLVRFRSF